MDYDDNELIEEKSFKLQSSDTDEMFHDDTEDPLGPGPDDDFPFGEEETPEEELGDKDGY